MMTAIQVSAETATTLKRLRQQYHLASYDETIRRMIAHTRPLSLKGFLKTKIPMNAILKDLRDKHDRF
ncbi:hypothetical protein HY641_00285 [Candidatus Woesearchaeota archaeon]|nr:hypothetical protein [Candidatus Woesearchaeota archaeon]